MGYWGVTVSLHMLMQPNVIRIILFIAATHNRRYELEFLKLLSDHGVEDNVNKEQLTAVFAKLQDEIGLQFDIARVRVYGDGASWT